MDGVQAGSQLIRRIRSRDIRDRSACFDRNECPGSCDYSRHTTYGDGFDLNTKPVLRSPTKKMYQEQPSLSASVRLSEQESNHAGMGETKSHILRQVVEEQDSDFVPASLVQLRGNAHIYCDLLAADELTRIKLPWCVTSLKWTDKLIRRAIVWLCEQVDKPILKLTNQDYSDHQLSELLTIYGSACQCEHQGFQRHPKHYHRLAQVESLIPMTRLGPNVRLHTLSVFSSSVHILTMTLFRWEAHSAGSFSRGMMYTWHTSTRAISQSVTRR